MVVMGIEVVNRRIEEIEAAADVPDALDARRATAIVRDDRHRSHCEGDCDSRESLGRTLEPNRSQPSLASPSCPS